MGPNAMILVFWTLNFKPAVRIHISPLSHQSSSIFHQQCQKLLSIQVLTPSFPLCGLIVVPLWETRNNIMAPGLPHWTLKYIRALGGELTGEPRIFYIFEGNAAVLNFEGHQPETVHNSAFHPTHSFNNIISLLGLVWSQWWKGNITQNSSWSRKWCGRVQSDSKVWETALGPTGTWILFIINHDLLRTEW